ncbi:hypothetical protein A6F68_00839 [Tsuneonella dongtanensis]|uniref:Uncharacterized protein n=2 Tax=Tsuneonella dongtanensis TaxID=692370 RepID=A0A1B2ABF4_9SPHN|nr:hypothetical protein A6F68_00839 [Tsuneonella dongtanensis]
MLNRTGIMRAHGGGRPQGQIYTNGFDEGENRTPTADVVVALKAAVTERVTVLRRASALPSER